LYKIVNPFNNSNKLLKGFVTMKKITEKELGAYNELLVQEKAAIDKFNYYAQNCKDPNLKKLCKDAAARHQEHFNIIFAQIQ